MVNVNDGQFLFNAHKMIITMKSEVLGAMLLDSPTLEDQNQKPVIFLQEPEDCSQVFSRFLYFMYSGAVWLHRDYVIPLHQLAVKYSVKPLQHHCQNYILQILHNSHDPMDNDPSTPRGFQLDTIVNLYENDKMNDDVRTLCFRIMCLRAKDLVKSRRWPDCSWQIVHDLLRSDECNAEENILLTAATEWMKRNNLNDKSRIEDILTNIRYPLLHRRVLYHLQKNNAFKNFPPVHDLVMNAVNYHCFKDLPEARNDFTGIQFETRSRPVMDTLEDTVIQHTAL